MKRDELFNLFEQEYPLECRTFKAFRFSLLLTSVSFIHHRIDIRLHNSTASEEQGLESLADSSTKRDIRSRRVSNERGREGRERGREGEEEKERKRENRVDVTVLRAFPLSARIYDDTTGQSSTL